MWLKSALEKLNTSMIGSYNMKFDINYLDHKGNIAETINYKTIKEFEKEIRECFDVGRPIDFKYIEQEIER